MKTAENDDLSKNLKHLKVVELQKEISLYSRECGRLKDIVGHLMNVAKNHGLEKEINTHPDSRDYSLNFTHSVSQSSLHKRMVKESSADRLPDSPLKEAKKTPMRATPDKSDHIKKLEDQI